MPIVNVNLSDVALASSVSGAIVVSAGPGQIPLTPTALAFDSGTQTLAIGAVAAVPQVDHGTQGGTIVSPTPQTLWQHQPRDPAFGPWHCHSGGQYFGPTWDPVLYFGYNSHYAPNHNPDEPSCTLNHEVNYFEEPTGKITFEAYNEFLSADKSIRVRPWAFTLDKATGSNRYTINIGPADTYGFFSINSQDTVLWQLTGGGISTQALDTVATLSWSSVETFAHTSNADGSTLTLKGVPAKLHLDHGNSMVQWQDQWREHINNADLKRYTYDMRNSRNHVVYTGGASSSAASTTFNSKVVANSQLNVINGAPLNFAARGRAIGIGPSTQIVDNYTSYLSYSASSAAADNTINFDVCNGTISGHVTPLSLRGNNTVAILGAATIAGSLTVGGGTVITKVLSAAAVLDFGTAAAQSSADLTVSVTGAAVGDPVSLGVPAAPAANTSFSAWVSAPDTVSLRFNNYSAASVDPTSGTYRVAVIKF